MRYPCHGCGKSVSSELPDDSVIRAMLMCPECIAGGTIIFKKDLELMQQAFGPDADVKEMGRLPDGSGFALVSFPLPADHWSKQGQETPERPWSDPGPAPMPFRCGTRDKRRDRLAEQITAAARYAYKASTECGKVDDLDPDALVQNFIVGMIGYWTPDGTSQSKEINPDPLPPVVELEAHRCVACGHRWDGPLKGAELCGDCWREAFARLHKPLPTITNEW